MENFNEIKEEVLKRAKRARACHVEYKRALESESIQELLKVITDNFFFSCLNKIIDVDFLEKIGKEACERSDLFFNVNTNKGFLIASGSSTVYASGSAAVYALDNSKVHASGTATVEAYDNSTVYAFGSVQIIASDNTIVKAYDNSTIKAYDHSTIEAHGSSYINSFNNIGHVVSERAILRYYHTNKVVLADVDSFSK